MSEIATKYVRRPFEVDAVQVTDTNLEQVAQWCGGEVRQKALTSDEDLPTFYVKVRVYRPLNEKQSEAFVGDWVLYAGTGYKVYTTNAFENSFVEAAKAAGESILGMVTPPNKTTARRVTPGKKTSGE